MNPQTIPEIELTGKENVCHRRQPVLLPEALGKVRLIYQPCIREKCTLWDPVHDCCLDVSNAAWLVEIAKSLENLVKQADVLCFHAGEK